MEARRIKCDNEPGRKTALPRAASGSMGAAIAILFIVVTELTELQGYSKCSRFRLSYHAADLESQVAAHATHGFL